MDSLTTDLAVIGSGPGGYAAAFYAADRGQRVTLIEEDRRLGGVCLNRGCIPSKALLHATALIREAKGSGQLRGITFGAPTVELEKLRAWKETILQQLGQGIETLAHHRNVRIVRGRARFERSTAVQVDTAEGPLGIAYTTAIIASGSQPARPTALAIDSPKLMTSTEALELRDMPDRLLVVGGGYIGLELGTVYATLGSRVDVVEALGSLLSGADADLIRPVQRYAERAFASIRCNTKVVSVKDEGAQMAVTTESGGEQETARYDRVLLCVGRVPNCDDLGLERTRVARNTQGLITVDARQQTADSAIYAIGDVVGGPLLAHKARHEARVAVEAIAGASEERSDAVIPSVVFTDPELAWCGLTEAEASAKGVPITVARFPWSASGRALTLDRPDGMTKLVIDPETERILGVGIVGAGAAELISEGVLAVETRVTAKTLARSVHPHPTLSETLMECAEVFYGQAIHVAGRRASRQSQVRS